MDKDVRKPESLTDRFNLYFKREEVESALKSISDGAEVEFKIIQPPLGTTIETFTLTRTAGKNEISPGRATSPNIMLTFTPAAAEQVLSDPSQDIGTMGINVAKLIASSDPNLKASIKFHSNFLVLFAKGYLGVLATGGATFATYLASRGLTGIAAIKAAFKKIRG